MNPAFKSVTLAMLTSHRSGLTGAVDKFDNGNLWKKLWDEKLNPSEGRRLVANSMLIAPPASTPGTKFEYSNANYMILAAVMESVTRKSWEQLIREDIFVPLKMASCGFGNAASPTAEPPDQPWPHTLTIAGPASVAPSFQSDNPPSVGPAGTVHCSMQDWAKFARLHINAFYRSPVSLPVADHPPDRLFF